MESISAMASLSQSPKRAGPTDATAGQHDSRELTELVSKQVHMAHLSQERGGGPRRLSASCVRRTPLL